jgi:hypothetical protein
MLAAMLLAPFESAVAQSVEMFLDADSAQAAGLTPEEYAAACKAVPRACMISMKNTRLSWGNLVIKELSAKELRAVSAAAMPANAQKASPCGPAIKHSTRRVDYPSPLEARPPQDRALIYVVRPAYGHDQTKLSVDREWVGVNQSRSYFLVALAPGEHALCSQAENASRLTVQLEAGRIYYFQQHVIPGIWRIQTELSQISEAEGKAALAKCKRMIFWEKGSKPPSSHP